MVRKVPDVDVTEKGRLQDAVSKMEIALYFAGTATSEEVSLMRRFIQNAKDQIGKIEVEQQAKEQESKSQERQEFEFQSLVLKETALNSAERKEYDGFLHKEFFTKSDFDGLAHFYSHSWDKLTEGGKEQMSSRVWGGIRHGEYKFEELPDVVKEKEARFLHERLTRPVLPDSVKAIPKQDRNDFVSAYEENDRQRAYAVLERPSFVEHVGAESRVIASLEATSQREAIKKEVKHPAPVSVVENPPSKATSLCTLDLDSGLLASLREAQTNPSSKPKEIISGGDAGSRGKAGSY